MITPSVAQLAMLAGYCILSRRGKISLGQHLLNLAVWITFAYGTRILRAIDGRLVPGLVFCFSGSLGRMIWLFSERTRNTTVRPSTDTCSLGVFMGSGGHTAEMKALLSTLDFKRYTPRAYVYCHGDLMSTRVIDEVETAAGGSDSSATPSHTLLALPRARQVGEGRISTAFSASKTLLAALWHTFLIPLMRDWRRPWVDVLLINGPGTAVVLVAVAWIRRFFGLRWTKIIYVESFARTSSLSLSGRLLRSSVDVFVVQWPDAGGPGSTIPFLDRKASEGQTDSDPKVVHRGWLV